MRMLASVSTCQNTCDHITVALRTVDHCNLQSLQEDFFQETSLVMSQEVILLTVRFLVNGCRELAVKRINLILYWDFIEQRTQAFDEMCSLLRGALDPLVDLSIELQTKGAVFSNVWVDLLNRHCVAVKVICGVVETDGCFNPVFVDCKDGILEEKAEDCIRKIKGKITDIGIVYAIDTSKNPREVYDYFKNDLKVCLMDFVLPNYTQDTFFQDPIVYGDFLCKLFDVWAEDRDSMIHVPILEQIIKQLMLDGKILDETYLERVGVRRFNYKSPREIRRMEFIISASGALGSADVLHLASSNWRWGGDSVESTSLADYIRSPLLVNLQDSLQILPDPCQQCLWKRTCKGGYMIHRYSKKADFNNASIYCEGLKLLYAYVVKKTSGALSV